MFEIPRHWEKDRLVTWTEFCGRAGGLLCMECDAELTGFDQCASRLTDDSATEIAFSDEDIIPITELICASCAEKP